MQFTVNYFRRGVRCAVVKFRFIKNVHSYQTTGVYKKKEHNYENKKDYFRYDCSIYYDSSNILG